MDWSERFPLSLDEMAKFGIEVSEDGPVMIPLDKAMAAAKGLLAGAKTIYSVRDGLEAMRRGLDSETQKIRKLNKAGVPAAVI